MLEHLADEISLFNLKHQKTASQLEVLQGSLERWDNYFRTMDLTEVDTLRGSGVEGGLEPEKLRRSMVVSPALPVVDAQVVGWCGRSYLRSDRSLSPCGGYYQRSACPPFAPSPGETLRILGQSTGLVVIQAEGLTSYADQKRLHLTLLEVEKHLETRGVEVVCSWSAGPCRLCEPENECLREGRCRQPEGRRFSMEGSGIGVFLLGDEIARMTGDDSWELSLIENWGLQNQSRWEFKSVIALAVK